MFLLVNNANVTIMKRVIAHSRSIVPTFQPFLQRGSIIWKAKK